MITGQHTLLFYHLLYSLLIYCTILQTIKTILGAQRLSFVLYNIPQNSLEVIAIISKIFNRSVPESRALRNIIRNIMIVILLQ